MRYVLLFTLFIIFGFASEQRKIILSSYAKSSIAVQDFANLQHKFSKKLLKTLQKEKATIKTRKSGKLFIIVIEPIKNKKSALYIKSLLPKPFNKSGYINAYTPPKKPKKSEKIDLNKAEKKSEKISIDTNNTKTAKATQEITIAPKTPELNETNITKEIIKTEINSTKNESKEIKQENKDTAKLASPKNETKELVTKEPIEHTTIEPKNTKIQSDYEEKNSISIGSFFENAKSSFVDIIKTLSQLFTQYIFVISLIILILAFIIYYRTIKIKILHKRQINLLEKEKEEKAMLAQSLRIEVNHLKSRYFGFAKSLVEPIEALQNKFQKSTSDPAEKETAKIVNTLAQILASYQDLGEHIVMDESEFNLNSLVSHVVKHEKIRCEEGIGIVKDFDLPMLKKVVGDKQKAYRIFSLLIKFACLNTHIGRVLVSLNQASQDVDGKVMIHVIIKSGKNGFSKNATKSITDAFSNRVLYDDINMPKDIYDLKVVKRLVEAMNGSIEFVGGESQESGFLFNLQFKVINRYALQESLLSRQHGLKMSIFLLEDDETDGIKNDLKSIGIEPKIYPSWSELVQNFKDVYIFADVIILQNSYLCKIDANVLINMAKRKNFAILVVVDEGEMEDKIIYTLRDGEKELTKEDKTTIRILQKPYSESELLSLLTNIYEEQKPADLSSHVD